jgi:phosphatidylethanolamine-binding protein (PEBP) family uncharacterized protein
MKKSNFNFITIIWSLIIFTQFSCKKSETTSTTAPSTAFTLTSIAVQNGFLLDAYKCEPKVSGVEKSIPLSWSNIPSTAKSLAISMIHYPNAADSSIISTYLTLWNIDKSVTAIPYGMAKNGAWFMGANKDGNVISYTSPCSAGSGTHNYIITLYALSAVPPSLPTQHSLSVNYAVLKNALTSVTVIDKAVLNFKSVTP